MGKLLIVMICSTAVALGALVLWPGELIAARLTAISAVILLFVSVKEALRDR